MSVSRMCSNCRYVLRAENEAPCEKCLGRGGLPHFRARWRLLIWYALFGRRGRG